MTLGIDLGAATTRIALLDPAKPMPVIVRNELSNEATSTVVSYPENEERCFGENAVSKQITKPSETVVDLAEWLFGCSGNSARMPPSVDPARDDTKRNEEEGLRPRQIGGGMHHPVQVTAYFIKSVLGFVPGHLAQYPVCLSIPTAVANSAAVALRQACAVAGVPKESTLIAPSDEAMAVYFHHMHYSDLSEETESHVIILDIGQSSVSACFIAVTAKSIRKLAAQSLRLGSGFIDGALCSFVYSEIGAKYGETALQGDVKSLRRILRECRKAKEILSTVEETKIQLEALQGHMDVTIPLSRTQLEELARPFTDELNSMLANLKASIPPLSDGAPTELRVEVIGGGWRATFVGDLVRRVLGVQKLGVSLDANLAVAEGSAILAQVCAPFGARSFEDEEKESDGSGSANVHPAHKVTLVDFAVVMPHSPTSRPLSKEDESVLAEWAEVECGLAAADAVIRARLAAVNKLDSFVLQTLETMEASDATEERKLEVRRYLMAIDDYSKEGCEGADTEAILLKLAEVQAHVQSEFPEVQHQLDRAETERTRKEEELTRLSKEQEKEEKELKTDPQRLRAAQKRREQGANLFKQEHWQEAQTRFVQALAILGQLYDVSSDETRKTRDEIVLSCHLNIASCSVKLGLWKNAISNCTSALDLSPQHPKAFFRRGQAYAGSRDFKEAVHDFERAAKLSNNDPAVVAELNAAKANWEAQKAKEKKMFAKMFS